MSPSDQRPSHLHIGPADIIEDLGLADIDVPQDAADGRPEQLLVGVLTSNLGAGQALGLMKWFGLNGQIQFMPSQL